MRDWTVLAVLGVACMLPAQIPDPSGKYIASNTQAWQVSPAKSLAKHVKQAFLSPDGKWVAVLSQRPPVDPETPLIDRPLPQVEIISTVGQPSFFICDLKMDENISDVAWSVWTEMRDREWELTGRAKYCFLASIQVTSKALDADNQMAYYVMGTQDGKGAQRRISERMTVRGFAPGGIAAYVGFGVHPEDKHVYEILRDGVMRENRRLTDYFRQGYEPLELGYFPGSTKYIRGGLNLPKDGTLVLAAWPEDQVPKVWGAKLKLATFNLMYGRLDPWEPYSPKNEPNLILRFFSPDYYMVAPVLSSGQNDYDRKTMRGVSLSGQDDWEGDASGLSLDESTVVYSIKGELFVRQISPMDFKEYQRLTKTD